MCRILESRFCVDTEMATKTLTHFMAYNFIIFTEDRFPLPRLGYHACILPYLSSTRLLFSTYSDTFLALIFAENSGDSHCLEPTL